MKGNTIIKIEGHLNCKWKECFEGWDISYEENNTILKGKLKDEAHMHGILNDIRDYNLTLISINSLKGLQLVKDILMRFGGHSEYSRFGR